MRPLVIGRIAKLSQLNGSAINLRERRDAEKIYLRAILSERSHLLRQAQSDKTATEIDQGLALLHPRYLSLKTLYEQELLPMGGAGAMNKGGDQNSLASEMLSITLKNMIILAASGPSEPVTKRLPASLTIGKLRLLIKQVFGVDPTAQHLALRVYKDSIPIELDDDQSSLQYYGAVDGADIFINEKE